jgi:ABC-type uncharacterized transport system ATPase subunit
MPQSASTREPLRLRGVTRSFGDVTALDSVDIDIRPGEVHCLLGENGAGKSTLISVLAGMQQPDRGTLMSAQESVVFRSPADAQVFGIAVVYQHSMLVPTLTVRENLFLAQPPRLRQDREAAQRVLTDLNRALNGDIRPRTKVSELGLGQRQHLEIARALATQPNVLILDEPTTMLNQLEVRALASSIRATTARGGAVVLVTHQLDEVWELADRITVLRNGRVADHLGPTELRAGDRSALKERVLGAMFGLAVPTTVPSASSSTRVPDVHRAPTQTAHRDDVVRLHDVSTTSSDGSTPIKEISLRVAAGEIVGVAGIDGHGQRHLAKVIAGEVPASKGSIMLDGTHITRLSVKQRQRLGLAYVTDDRMHEGIFASFSVAMNLAAKRVGEHPLWRHGRLRHVELTRFAQQLIKKYDIRPTDPNARAGALSGGNIQKLLFARELAHAPRVLVCSQPTHGLDVHTAARVWADLRAFAADGGAVLCLSNNLDEVVDLSDRVVVIANGHLIGEMSAREPDSREQIGRLVVKAQST